MASTVAVIPSATPIVVTPLTVGPASVRKGVASNAL